MSKSIGTDGCTTTHGGVVKATQTTATHNGSPMLQLGDGFTCPVCKSWSTLISCSSTLSFNGIKAALEGDKFSCGAILISTQSTATAINQSQTININSLTNFSNFSNDSSSKEYGLVYELIDEQTKKPFINYPYSITTDDGEVIEGFTDSEGRTALTNTKNISKEVTLTFHQFDKPLDSWE